MCRKRRHTKLCDFSTGRRGHTCSKLLCNECTTHIAPNTDYCPEHKEGPPSLFRGLESFIELGKEPDPVPEHFTKTTIEASFWCPKCHKPTMHNVHSGRRGGCQECIRRLEALPKQPPKPIQESLF